MKYPFRATFFLFFLAACSSHKKTELPPAVAAPAPLKMRDLVVKRFFDAPVAKVWDAWSQPKKLRLWWGPKDFTSPVAKIDFKVGGKYLLSMRSKQGQTFWSAGVYTKIEKNKSFETDDSFSDEKGEIVPATHYGMPAEIPIKVHVTVSFLAQDKKHTEMTLTQTDVPVGEITDLSLTGWNESFDKLAEVLSGKRKK